MGRAKGKSAKRRLLNSSSHYPADALFVGTGWQTRAHESYEHGTIDSVERGKPLSFQHVFSAEIEALKQACIARTFPATIIFRDVREMASGPTA